MKKRIISLILAATMALALLTGCQSSTSSGSASNNTSSTDTSKAEEVTYPDGDLRIVVPFATGGALDVQVRTVAKYLADELGTNVIVENKTGAGGVVGISDYLTEEANTNTIVLMDAFLLTGTPYVTNVQYTADDYMPIIDLKTIPYVLYTSPAQSGMQSFDDLKAAGSVKFGSDGPGTFLYTGTSALLSKIGVEGVTITHDGFSAGIANMISGVTDVMLGTTIDSAVRDYVASGDLVPLVYLADEDYPADDVFTDGIPCAKTLGVDMTYYGFYYFAIRKGTDQAIIDKLYDAFSTVYANSDFQAEAAPLGILCEGLTADQIQDALSEMTETNRQYLN